MPAVPSAKVEVAATDPQFLLRQALLLDLELTATGRIREAGAAVGERSWHQGPSLSNRDFLDKIEAFGAGARFLIGHNLFFHDRPALQEMAEDHPLLRRPVIDTLVLSPIAFPENPYHRLIKDYKLVRESISQPVADARQAGRIFVDEFLALEALRRSEPDLFLLLHFLLGTPDVSDRALADGLDAVFTHLGSRRPDSASAAQLAANLCPRWGCRHQSLAPERWTTARSRLAAAYAVSWLRVAGSNSVLPPWVRLQFPETGVLIRQLRETPCSDTRCQYCQQTHNPRTQLQRFFGFDAFRATPASPSGGSLQQDIIEAGLRDESLLAVLPTGGGKSLCFQLPGLVRNQRRGVLTVVISPLQALMKDQVDGLMRRTGTPFAAALYGLLTPPERGDVLEQVKRGDVAILYVSPEQLRNNSFRQAIQQREIGCWVFDEAHCLSKWGHDFRPDYLYAGRFIRETFQQRNEPIPAIACFTATAKTAVRDEILTYFQTETGRKLQHFEGGVERDNLHFDVQAIADHSKLERVHDLLSDRLPAERGSAIIFRATRESTEVSAEYLKAKGWAAACFHAGMSAADKKQTQERFLQSEIRVICATNAFGMGIDKEDVRLVIHADTPGSLENYLQEAGRAGRDGNAAECILLFNEEDCEQQFRMGALSELTRKDISQILRSLRNSQKPDHDDVIITTGEILRDEAMEAGLNPLDRQADTQVRTAIAWLERAGFIQRDENVTTVFQARPLVQDLHEAQARMEPLNLPAHETRAWLAILRVIFNTAPTDQLTVDQLALLPELAPPGNSPVGRRTSPELVSARVLKTLASMTAAGLMKRDTLLNAFVRHKIADSSKERLSRCLRLDQRLLELLVETEPDPEDWSVLALRPLNQALLDEGWATSPDTVRSLLKSLSEDGRGFAGSTGSIELRYLSRDQYRVRLKRPWAAIRALAEKRRAVAALLFETIRARISPAAPPKTDLLVDFSFEDLGRALEADPVLRQEIKDVGAALERGLMFLHEQEIIILQQGLAVFRSAMRIRLQPEARGQIYKVTDYQPLKNHYSERILQVHVMGEYARLGVRRIREAVELVVAYFRLGREAFIRRYLASNPEILELATTAESFQRIVTDLENPAQIAIVTAPVRRNLLILAGPGSGKTRTLVHRCAYLLRVKRVRSQSILVCCFNRDAATELRRRLNALAGQDARGVTVLTYHGLALRLLGRSVARPDGALEGPETPDFDRLIHDATALLRGDTATPGLEADAVRERILAGFEHVLVDEYQDIDEAQYQLISALTGRSARDPDLRLSILAVGDDDQNIYTFRGANVEFIRRFQQDYNAELHQLVENYRSTRYIIEAANTVIASNRDRMKLEHPIRIDQKRELFPAGGDFGRADTAGGGRVRLVRPHPANRTADAVLAQIRHLQSLGVVAETQIAVLAPTHRELADLRTLAEQAGLPVRWQAARAGFPPLNQVREIYQFLQQLTQIRSHTRRASDLLAQLSGPERTEPASPPGESSPSPAPAARNPWWQVLLEMLQAWRLESEDADLPVSAALEFLHELCWEGRREIVSGHGTLLSTIHAAKGTEHDHVILLAPALPIDPQRWEESRRAFYVGMTRARHSLTIIDIHSGNRTLTTPLHGPAVFRETFTAPTRPFPIPRLTYEILGLKELHLGYPGRFPADHTIHGRLRQLNPGDRVQLQRSGENQIEIQTLAGVCVGRLSQLAVQNWTPRLTTIREVRVLAMVRRRPDEEADGLARVPEWEVPLLEIVSTVN